MSGETLMIYIFIYLFIFPRNQPFFGDMGRHLISFVGFSIGDFLGGLRGIMGYFFRQNWVYGTV